METVNAIDYWATAVFGMIGHSMPMMMVLIGLAAAGWFAIFKSEDRPRFDPLKHMPHPPTIEHEPQRGLPPGRAYVEWTAEEEKKKDHAPWDR